MKIPDWLRLMTASPQKRLSDGTVLRLLTAQQVLEARREALTLADGTREQALCSNACLLARAWCRRGKPIYPTGKAVLEHLTVGRVQALARQWAAFDRTENPGLSAQAERVDALKKAWSTCRGSAFAGVCSKRSGRCRQNRESKT